MDHTIVVSQALRTPTVQYLGPSPHAPWASSSATAARTRSRLRRPDKHAWPIARSRSSLGDPPAAAYQRLFYLHSRLLERPRA